MPDIDFGGGETVEFPSKYHGDVTLSKTKWNIICNAPERHYYRYNGEKVATTLINPDQVRHHKHEPNQFLYYKRFSKIYSDRGIEFPPPMPIFFTVIIDSESSRICTIYPVSIPKIGKAFAPKRKT